MKHRSLVIGALLVALVGCNRATVEPMPVVALETLDFPAKDVSTASWDDKLVLVDFWATWCGPCREMAPQIQWLHETYGSKGLTVVGVSYEPRQPIVEYEQATKHTYTILRDPRKDLNSKLRVEALPTIMLVDHGKIVYRAMGPLQKEILENEIKSRLKL